MTINEDEFLQFISIQIENQIEKRIQEINNELRQLKNTGREILLSRKEAAKLLGISVMTLDRRRSSGEIPFLREGQKLIKFRERDLKEYLNGRVFNNHA